MCLKTSLFVPLSIIDYLFVFIRHRMQGSFETRSTRTGFPPSKQFLVDTCWVLFNPFSSDAIQLGDTSVICGLRPVF